MATRRAERCRLRRPSRTDRAFLPLALARQTTKEELGEPDRPQSSLAWHSSLIRHRSNRGGVYFNPQLSVGQAFDGGCVSWAGTMDSIDVMSGRYEGTGRW